MSSFPTWIFPSCTSFGWTKSTESTCSTSRRSTAQTRPSKSERVMRRMSAILAVMVVVTTMWVLASQPQGGDEVVVLELFTSQGCSSCPPADELLRQLASDRDLHVIALAYHVD